MKPVLVPEAFAPRLFVGVAGPAVGAFLEQLARDHPAPVTLALARLPRQLDALAEDISFFQRLAADGPAPTEVLLYPELPGEGAEAAGVAGTFERQCDRLAVLAALASQREKNSSAKSVGGRLLIVTTLAAVLQPAPRPGDLTAREIRLAAGARVNFRELAEKLGHELGYDHEALCETPGQYAVRGGLLDVYPFNAAAPVRLDFFGDELESIRRFDPTTQLTDEALPELLIAPAPREMKEGAPAGLLNFLPARAHWIIHEPARQAAEQPALFSVPEKLAAPHPTLQTILTARADADDAWTGLAELDESGGAIASDSLRVPVDSEPTLAHRPLANTPALGRARLESDQASQHAFLRLLAQWARAGTAVFIVTHAEGEAGRLREILAEDSSLKGFAPKILTGSLAAGFLRRKPTRGSTGRC